MDTATQTSEEMTSGAGTNGSDGDAAQAKPLVLPSLEIKNFRAFKHLTVEKLGRVNLITGKNNVGKTSLLEALWLYAEAANPSAIRQLLLDRAELEIQPNPLSGEDNLDRELDGTALFYGRDAINSPKRSFIIGTQAHDLIEEDAVYPNEVHVDLTFADTVLSPKGRLYTYVSGVDFFYDFDVITKGRGSIGRPTVLKDFRLPNLLLRTRRMNADRLAALWDFVVWESAEEDAVFALQIIDHEVEKVSFVAGEGITRVPVVKMQSEKRPLPLESYGEGFSRLLAIAASLTSTTDGILLIDEIENGLHYSVLPDVWRLIFQTARRLNVQVFATTHSWDCIKAFQEAVDEEDDPASGVLVRLQNINDNVTSTIFDKRRLAIVAYNDIEVR